MAVAKEPLPMQFDWKEANIAHIARHDVTPEEAEQVVENDPIDAGAVLRNGEGASFI